MKKIIFALIFLVSASVFGGGVKFDPQERKEYVFLDLRSLEEASVDHLDAPRLIPSIIIPFDEDFGKKIESFLEYKDKSVLIFCKTGRRSALGMKILEEAGFKDITNLKTLAEAKKFEREIRNYLYPTSNEKLLDTISGLQKKLNIDIITPLEEKKFWKISEILTPVIAENISTDKQTMDLVSLISELVFYIEKNHISSYYISPIDPFFKGAPYVSGAPITKKPSEAKREFELFEEYHKGTKESQDAIFFIDNSRNKIAMLLKSHREKMLSR